MTDAGPAIEESEPEATEAPESDDTGGASPDPPERTITDPASFGRGTSGERAVAGLLFYKELDCLVDLAYRVSLDFFDQPQLYRDVPAEIVADLTALRTRYGYQEEFLSREQRQAIFAGVFGDDEGAGFMNGAGATPAAYSFTVLRDQLLAAAAAFAERVFNTSEDMLRAAVRVMHVYLKDYMLDVTGASVNWSRGTGLPAITGLCYRILRDPQIAARFAVNAAAGQSGRSRLTQTAASLSSRSHRRQCERLCSRSLGEPSTTSSSSHCVALRRSRRSSTTRTTTPTEIAPTI